MYTASRPAMRPEGSSKKIASIFDRVSGRASILMELNLYHQIENDFTRQIRRLDKTEKEPQTLARKILADLVTNGASDELAELNKKLTGDQRSQNLAYSVQLAERARSNPFKASPNALIPGYPLDPERYREQLKTAMSNELAQKFLSALSVPPHPEPQLASPFSP